MPFDKEFAQKYLDDIFKLGPNNKRLPPKFYHNGDYLKKSDEEKNQHILELIKFGADPTPCFLRASYVGSLSEIETLINAGADINYRKGDGHCPLTYCVARNKPNHIKLLLKYNVDINVNYNGLNPFLMRFIYPKAKLSDKEEFKDILAKDNIPQGLFLHKIARKNMIQQIANTTEGKDALMYYVASRGYDLFQKDEHGNNFFDIYENSALTSKRDTFLLELEPILMKKHLEETISNSINQKSSLKI